MKNIVDVYTSMARVAHWIPDAECNMSLVRGPDKTPILIGDKRLVLPTDEHLSHPAGETIIFHPLREFLTRGESEVVAKFRQDMNWRFHLSYLAFASELLTIAAGVQSSAQLTPEQSEFLSFVPDADEQMVDTFQDLVLAMPEGQNQKVFCSIFLRKGGVIAGKSYHRAAIVNFPLYKQLVADGEARDVEMHNRKEAQARKKKDDKTPAKAPPKNETYGVELRAKDREAYIKLFEYMLPNIADENAYSVGSSSKIAPCISSLMYAAQQLGGPLNNLVDRFESRLSAAAVTILTVEDAWIPVFDNLAPWQVEIHKVPAQDGNGGPTASQEAMKAEAEATYVPGKAGAHPPTNPHDGKPDQAANHEPQAPAGFRLPPVSAAPVVIQAPIPHMPTPHYPTMNMTATPGYPVPQYPVQSTGYPVPHQNPTMGHAPVPTQSSGGGRGVDFNDLLRSQPALQIAAAQSQQAQYGVQPQQQQRVDLPTWAVQMTGTQRPAGHQGQPQQQGMPTMGRAGQVGYPHTNDPYSRKL